MNRFPTFLSMAKRKDVDKDPPRKIFEAEPVPPAATSDEESNDDDSDDINIEDYEEIDIGEEYDSLKKKDGKVTAYSLTKWEEIKSLIDEELLTKAQIYDIVAGVLKKTTAITDKEAKTINLTKEQFVDIVNELDELAGGGDDDEDDEEYYDDDNEDIEAEEDAERLELFERLKKGKDKATIRLSELRKSEELQSLFEEGNIDAESWKHVIEEVLGKGINPKTAEITLEQFHQILDLLSEALEDDYDDEDEEYEGDDVDGEEIEEDAEGQVIIDTEGGDVTSETDSKTTKALNDPNRWKVEIGAGNTENDRRELFDRLRAKNGNSKEKIKVSDLRFSEKIKELIDEGSMKEKDFAFICKFVLANSDRKNNDLTELTYEEYDSIMDNIFGSVTDTSLRFDDDENKLYIDQYRDDAGKITLRSVLSQESIVESIETEVLSEQQIVAIAARALQRKKPITAKEYNDVVFSEEQLLQFLYELNEVASERVTELVGGPGESKRRQQLFDKLKKKKTSDTIRIQDLKKAKELPQDLSEIEWKDLLDSLYGDSAVNMYEINYRQFNDILNHMMSTYQRFD